MKVLGAILTLYLIGFIALFWKDGWRTAWDFFGACCATVSVVFIGLFMWRGLLLP